MFLHVESIPSLRPLYTPRTIPAINVTVAVERGASVRVRVFGCNVTHGADHIMGGE
jgi:hypothetical protein